LSGLGFYLELAPTFLNFACLASSVEGPPLDHPLRYCELGCGRGYDTILLAAANPESEFVGIDSVHQSPSHDRAKFDRCRHPISSNRALTAFRQCHACWQAGSWDEPPGLFLRTT
jgi:hypothetical protein